MKRGPKKKAQEDCLRTCRRCRILQPCNQFNNTSTICQTCVRPKTRVPAPIRTCSVCKGQFPLKEFSKAPSSPGGHTYQCKTCTKIKVREYYWGKLSIAELVASIDKDRKMVRLKEEYLDRRSKQNET